MLRFLRPSAIIRRHFISKGLLGGNRRWLIIGGTFVGLQMLRRHLSTTEVVPVYTDELLPGEKLIITHSPRPEKRRR